MWSQMRVQWREATVFHMRQKIEATSLLVAAAIQYIRCFRGVYLVFFFKGSKQMILICLSQGNQGMKIWILLGQDEFKKKNRQGVM